MNHSKLKQFGLELKKEREHRNLILDDISKKTKISLKFLEAIESGHFNFLPDPYVRYFVKSYIGQLGRNTDHYYRKFNELVRETSKPPQHNSKPPEHTTPPPSETNDIWNDVESAIKKLKERHLSLVISTAFLLLIISLMLIFDNNDSNGIIETQNGINQISGQDSQLASFSSFIPARKDLELNIVAGERTWLQIAVDDSVAQEFIFERGDTMTWEAKQKFLIRVGNGAGVRLYLNGNDLGKLGDRMEVLNFVLTKDGIKENRF